MKHCRLALLFLVAWVVFPAWAQAFPEEAEEATRPMEGGFSHTVEEGDTLWRLAETYLGDPGQWLLLWAANEQIENPNWIFPGELIFLKPSPSEVVEPSPAMEPPGLPGPPRRRERPAELPLLISVETLVTPAPLEGWGVIESSLVQAGMLSPLEEVDIRVKKDSSAGPGETFLILRSQGKLKHPKTKKVLGHLTSVVGAAQLHAREGRRAVARIVRANVEVLRGDMLGPVGESHIRPVLRRKNDKSMEGWVVAMEPLKASMAGGQYLVFVDKGSVDGVAPGNSFHIMRQQDGLSLQTVLKPALVHKGLPRKAVGECTLVDVRPNVSSCLLTWASREIVPGDSVEMREER